ncbi:MAG: hypothetical protein E5X53_33215 [Mesorhizobium sp.]|nr:MAG: hypothetical protein E5X55_32995 [Mesorhizobium sp.]TIR47624.1 MAG: hypothetical protein E5X53_33215 [Mesorhizobium sp.]TJV92865.1 MAG: hypothetical protein E5X52_32795 [Mesorhizobium sp.]
MERNGTVQRNIGRCGHRSRKQRRKSLGALPAHLERTEQIVDTEATAVPGALPKAEPVPCCNGDLHVIGEDVSDHLDVVPAQFCVPARRRPRYGCRGCDEALDVRFLSFGGL